MAKLHYKVYEDYVKNITIQLFRRRISKKARQLGIELDELKPNPGLRFIAKICLNSLCGKFGQNSKITRREYMITLENSMT